MCLCDLNTYKMDLYSKGQDKFTLGQGWDKKDFKA